MMRVAPPLSFAAQRRFGAVAKDLLAAKADPNAGKLDLPLACAAWNGDRDLVEALLAHGAAVDSSALVDWSFRTPAFRGFADGGGSMIKATPLLLAISARHSDVVAALLKAKANPNQADEQSIPILFRTLGNPPALRALLEHGADPNAFLDRQGLSILGAAVVSSDNPAAVELLLTHGA